jgi:hypothetical protein
MPDPSRIQPSAPPPGAERAPSKPAARRRTKVALTPRQALVALTVAAASALLVPDSRVGLGVAVVAVAIVASAVGSLPDRNPWRIACLLLAGALALTPLIRDAGWLIGLDYGVALLLCAATLVEGRSWRHVLRGPSELLAVFPSAPAAVLRGTSLPAAAGGLSSSVSVQGATRGALLGGGLVLVFGALFTSADGAFAQLAGSFTPGPQLLQELPLRGAFGVLGGAIAGSLAMVSLSPPAVATPKRGLGRLAPLEWTLALGALAALFVAFVVVQFVVLFDGHTHVLETAGLTYADYAHRGFGQLLVASGLVLAVVAGAKRWAIADAEPERRLLRALLAILCVCTLVIVASALHRLDIYVDAFGATRLRVLAALTCASIGGVVALVLATLVFDRDSWLPRATIVTAGIAALVLTGANPDAWIASRNVDRYEREGSIDVAYAASLSADATPALSELPPDLAVRTLDLQRARLASGDGLFGLNLSRDRARTELTRLP